MANTNEALVYAWNVQALGATAGQTGYAQNGVNPAAAQLSAASQPSGGLPNPANAEDVQGEAAGSQTAQILTNPGYAGNPVLISTGAVPASLVPVPATTVAFQNPTGLNCTVSILTGTLTVISVAPLVNGAAGSYTQVGTTAPAEISVPPSGFIKMTFSVAPTWVWTATN